MKNYILIISLLSALAAGAQNNTTPAPVTVELHGTANTGAQPKIYTFVEQQPQFPGGDAALMAYLKKSIHYPEAAKEQGIQGTVLMRLLVNEDGSVSDVTVIRSANPLLDAEAVRVLSAMPKFTPGKQQGKPVKVFFNVPVTFKL